MFWLLFLKTRGHAARVFAPGDGLPPLRWGVLLLLYNGFITLASRNKPNAWRILARRRWNFVSSDKILRSAPLLRLALQGKRAAFYGTLLRIPRRSLPHAYRRKTPARKSFSARSFLMKYPKKLRAKNLYVIKLQNFIDRFYNFRYY